MVEVVWTKDDQYVVIFTDEDKVKVQTLSNAHEISPHRAVKEVIERGLLELTDEIP